MATNQPVTTFYNTSDSQLNINKQPEQFYPNNVDYHAVQSTPLIDYKRNLPVITRDTTGESAALCFFAYGMTTTLYNLSLVGAYDNNAQLMSLELVFGGFVLFISGILEWIKGNTINGLVWTNIGALWIINVFAGIFQMWGWAPAPDKYMSGCYMLIWWLFTLFFAISTLTMDPISMVAGFTICINFLLVTISNFCGGKKNLLKVAGYFGIISGVTAYYLACRMYLNAAFGKVMMPNFGKGEVLMSPIKPKYE